MQGILIDLASLAKGDQKRRILYMEQYKDPIKVGEVEHDLDAPADALPNGNFARITNESGQTLVVRVVTYYADDFTRDTGSYYMVQALADSKDAFPPRRLRKRHKPVDLGGFDDITAAHRDLYHAVLKSGISGWRGGYGMVRMLLWFDTQGVTASNICDERIYAAIRYLNAVEQDVEEAEIKHIRKAIGKG
jgi:hypothetical protein